MTEKLGRKGHLLLVQEPKAHSSASCRAGVSKIWSMSQMQVLDLAEMEGTLHGPNLDHEASNLWFIWPVKWPLTTHPAYGARWISHPCCKGFFSLSPLPVSKHKPNASYSPSWLSQLCRNGIPLRQLLRPWSQPTCSGIIHLPLHFNRGRGEIAFSSAVAAHCFCIGHLSAFSGYLPGCSALKNPLLWDEMEEEKGIFQSINIPFTHSWRLRIFSWKKAPTFISYSEICLNFPSTAGLTAPFFQLVFGLGSLTCICSHGRTCTHM